ncbi:CG5694 [Drosophila busckii]|uniref:CG5694 n=1 Tax=Drosophila busckii TaxID=30019 RepID=A0A0M3QTN1_DROBS|nr:CG5694 [Drosophila busckii]
MLIYLFQEHEKICNIEEDVILCDSPEPDSKYDSKSENSELRNAFLLNFCLQTKESDHNLLHHMPRAHLNKDEIIMETSKRNRRFSARRNRAAPSLNRCSFIPISSPAGKKLVISLKQPITLEYISERQDRIDRFCYTPLILKANYKCKPFEKKFGQNVHCTYKKSHEASQHIYAFPRRQFSQRRDTTQNFLFLNSPLIKQCRPISVRLKKLSDSVGEQYSVSNSKLNIRLTRDTSLNSQWRISPSSEVVVDTIDLCSSDDDDQIVSSPKKGNSEVISCISLSKSNTVSKVRSNYSVQNDHLSSYSQLTDDNSLKPLQQSVYIFSNYKTNSVLNRFSESKVNNHNKPLKTTNTFSHSTNSQSFNQENCNLPKNMISVTDWCAHSAITENKDIMQSDSTITFDNLSVVQPFSSSSRIISIDLTS